MSSPAASRDEQDANLDSVGTAEGGQRGPQRSPKLDVLKALGDNTRYAIYLEIVRSPVPLGTSEIADSLGLHVNTVRPHLERMRDVGLLGVTTEARRGVGRPQHLYSVADDAPSLGLEPPSYPMLASMLLRLVEQTGIDPELALEVGREQGEVAAAAISTKLDPVDALLADQARLGFDPQCVEDDQGCVVAFGHCPYGELARHNSEVVCTLHCGLVEGFVDTRGGGEVTAFHSLASRTPCQVELVTS